MSLGCKGYKYGFESNSPRVSGLSHGRELDLRDAAPFASGWLVHFCLEDMLCVAAALGLPELATAEMVVTADTPETHHRHTIKMSEGYHIWWPRLTSVCRCLSGCWFISSGHSGQMDADGCNSVTGCRLRAVSVCLEWGIGRNELGIAGEMRPCGFGILSMFIVFPRCSSSLPLCKALPGGLVTLIRWQTAANNIPHYCWHGRRT